MKENWKKNTVLFLTSQTMSLFGTMVVQYAIMWHIVLKTQSGFMMTLYIIMGVLPVVFGRKQEKKHSYHSKKIAKIKKTASINNYLLFVFITYCYTII